MRISIPYALSFLATRDIHGYVPGVNDILKGGYPKADGTKEMTMDEKIKNGRQAVIALQEFRHLNALERQNQLGGDGCQRREALKRVLNEKMPYFGYGFIKEKSQLVPYIPLCFYSFRIMVGLGTLFVVFFMAMLLVAYRKKDVTAKWMLITGMALLPLGYIASECGWLVAEFGRQPWAIQDMMPTWVGVSNIGSGSIMITFMIFLALFTTLLAVEISILIKAIKKGPDRE